jgi:hypothetical protein
VAFKCAEQENLDSFKLWLQHHDNSITQCSIEDAGYSEWWPDPHLNLDCLPCPQLRLLSLKYLKLQLEPAGDCPGVLQSCTRLQELNLEGCAFKDTDATFAAIAALPQLRSLCVVGVDGSEARLSGELQLLTHLTKLRLDLHRLQQPQQLGQLSALTSLEELGLRMPPDGMPGGLPSQLQKLTSLRVEYSLPMQSDLAEQFQHLSSLTALQDLAVKGAMGLSAGIEGLLDAGHLLMLGTFPGISTSHLTGIQHLSQLTSLELECQGLQFSAASTRGWVHSLAALERLSLTQCVVHANTLAAFTQLRALSVWELIRRAPVDGLLLAVSGLPHLTELTIRMDQLAAHSASQAACTALTAGTNLCSLQLGIGEYLYIADFAGFDLFTPGTVYPHMRLIDLCYDRGQSVTRRPPVSEQQLQQLCSCCPAVESLAFSLSKGFTAAALSPLLQLSALTSLKVGDVSAATTAAVGVAVQLTGLKELTLAGLSHLTDPTLLQLTALTALEELEFIHKRKPYFDTSRLEWKNKVRT